MRVKTKIITHELKGQDGESAQLKNTHQQTLHEIMGREKQLHSPQAAPQCDPLCVCNELFVLKTGGFYVLGFFSLVFFGGKK